MTPGRAGVAAAGGQHDDLAHRSVEHQGDGRRPAAAAAGQNHAWCFGVARSTISHRNGRDETADDRSAGRGRALSLGPDNQPKEQRQRQNEPDAGRLLRAAGRWRPRQRAGCWVVLRWHHGYVHNAAIVHCFLGLGFVFVGGCLIARLPIGMSVLHRTSHRFRATFKQGLRAGNACQFDGSQIELPLDAPGIGAIVACIDSDWPRPFHPRKNSH